MRQYLPKDTLLLSHFQNHETNRHSYLIGLAVDCFERPDDDRAAHYCSREIFWAGRPKSALKEFKRHIAMNRWPEEAAQSMVYAGDCEGQLNHPEEQVLWYHRAFHHCPTRREPLIKLALFYLSNKRWQPAICYAKAALEIPWGAFYSNKRDHYENLPWEILYIAYGWSGRIPEAQEAILKALEYQPLNPMYLRDTKYYFEYGDNRIEGWMTYPELKFLYETAQKMSTIAEVGSWKGRSTHALCSGCKGTVTAIDHFKGSADPKDGTHGGTGVYEQFIKNVGHFKNLKVKQMSGSEAAEGDETYDMVFLDAGHTEKEVKKDIEEWRGKAKILLCGHDYSNRWPGVVRAVDEAFGKPDGVADTIWWVDIAKRTPGADRGYNPAQNKIEGMMNPAELVWLFDNAKKVGSVCEIGSWMGKSAHALLSGCRGEVHCVDHFLGSADPIETGNKDVYPDFMRNVGHFKNLRVHRMSSLNGAKDFNDKSLDLVFIDGGHQYHEVLEDIAAWYPKAKKIFCGHDFQAEPVRRAVEESLGKTEVVDRIWFLDLENPLHQMCDKIKNIENFSFIKMGDGEMLAMLGANGANCDGQEYSKELGDALRAAYMKFGKLHNVQITRWKLGMEKEIESFEKEFGIKCVADHDLLLNRVDSLTPYHYNFWKAIKESGRHKIFVGPKKLDGVNKFLNIDVFVEIPEKNSFSARPAIKVKKGAIVLFSAGMASKVWASDYAESCQEATYIDCGSTFDPIFAAQTRTYQASKPELMKFYAGLL